MSFNSIEDCAANYQADKVYINRQAVLQQIFEILTRKPVNYPILLGEFGSGRSTCLSQLAHAFENSNVPTDLQGIRVKRVDLDLLELQSSEQFAASVNSIIQTERELSQPVLLVLDEIETLYQRNPKCWKTVLELMYQFEAQSNIRLALVCKPDFYYQHIAQNEKLSNMCEVVTFDRPEKDDLLRVLKAELRNQNSALDCSDELMQDIIRAAKHNIKNQVLPGSALSLLSKMISRAILESANELNSMHLQGVLAGWYGVYLSQQAIAEPKLLLTLVGQLKASVFGQDKALERLQKSLPSIALDLEKQKHCPCFVFQGPKSVGKRTTAKSMHALLYGEQAKLLTVDLELADKLDVRDAIIRRLEQHQLNGVLLLNAEKAKKSLLFYLQQVCEHRSIDNEQGRQYSLKNKAFIFLFNTEYDLSSFDLHQATSEKSESDHLLQLVVDDMPGGLGLLNQEVSLTSPSTNQFAKQRLPAWLNKHAIKVEFELLSYAAKIQLIDVFLKHLLQRAMLKHRVSLQFEDKFSKTLMLEFNLNHLSAKEIETHLRDQLVEPLGEHLLVSDKKALSLSVSDGKLLIN